MLCSVNFNQLNKQNLCNEYPNQEAEHEHHSINPLFALLVSVLISAIDAW